jgi:hypothetical protein
LRNRLRDIFGMARANLIRGGFGGQQFGSVSEALQNAISREGLGGRFDIGHPNLQLIQGALERGFGTPGAERQNPFLQMLRFKAFGEQERDPQTELLLRGIRAGSSNVANLGGQVTDAFGFRPPTEGPFTAPTERDLRGATGPIVTSAGGVLPDPRMVATDILSLRQGDAPLHLQPQGYQTVIGQYKLAGWSEGDVLARIEEAIPAGRARGVIGRS